CSCRRFPIGRRILLADDIEEAKLIAANAARYAVQKGYCTSVDTCADAAINIAIGELNSKALKQVDI
ncbi:hypothetical protein ACC745_38595, partial [Rhizobium ruizarguesonis]